MSALGWQRTHQCIDGNLYCTVSVWDEEKKQWIAKQDVGTKSYTESEKGQASDSFKRACFNIGIGRELYTAPPFIWVPAAKVKLRMKGERWTTYDRFHVQNIDYTNQREISMLVIGNDRGEIVYSWNVPRAATPSPAPRLSKVQLSGLQKELERTGIALEAVLQRYHVSSAEEMSDDIYSKAMSSLKKTRSRNSPAV